MKNTPIHELFEAMTPGEAQKARMWETINSVRYSGERNNIQARAAFKFKRRLLPPIAACLLMLVVSASAFAASEGNVISAITDKLRHIFFSNGDSIKLGIHEDGSTSVGASGEQGEWLVKETKGQLIASINGKSIPINDALKQKGYFYQDYRDDAGILHRVYVVRNAGGTKDHAERWYSQMEWLPELGAGGGSRGISGPLATAIMSAESEAASGDGSLDDRLKQHLEIYWEKYRE